MTSRLALIGLIGAVACANLPVNAQDLDPENTLLITTSDGCTIIIGPGSCSICRPTGRVPKAKAIRADAAGFRCREN